MSVSVPSPSVPEVRASGTSSSSPVSSPVSTARASVDSVKDTARLPWRVCSQSSRWFSPSRSSHTPATAPAPIGTASRSSCHGDHVPGSAPSAGRAGAVAGVAPNTE